MKAWKFLNDPADCKWLRETALKELVIPHFESFEFTGNEDCPEDIALYEMREPLVSDHPFMRLKWYGDINEYL